MFWFQPGGRESGRSQAGTLAGLFLHFSEIRQPRGGWTGGGVNLLYLLPCQRNDVGLYVFYSAETTRAHKYVLFYDDKAIYLDVFISLI